MQRKNGETAKKAARDWVMGQLALGRDAKDVLRELDLSEFVESAKPGRSTVYGWARAARERRARDKSGTWLLAHNKTPRPDLVLRVYGAVSSAWLHDVQAAGTTLVERHKNMPPVPPDITNAEAEWVAKVGAIVAAARPDMLRSRRAMLDLLILARDYVEAGRNVDDDFGLRYLDHQVANICFRDWED